MYGWDRPSWTPVRVPFFLLADGSKDREDRPSLPVPEPLTIAEIDEHAIDIGIGAADSECVFHLRDKRPEESESE